MENLKWCVGLFLFIAGAGTSHATSFVDRPFPASVQDAPVIVRGKVGNTYSDWAKSSDGTRRIYTFYDVQVDEVFKGNVNSRSLTMRSLGGQKDGIGMEVSGTASFERGEDVIVFLNEKNSDGHFDIRGMMMGKYNLQRDTEGKETIVGPGIAGSGDHSDHDSSPGQDDTRKQKWTLDDLRQLIASTSADAPQGAGASSIRPVKPPTSPVPTPLSTNDAKAPQLHSSPSIDSQPQGGESWNAKGRGIGFYAVIGLIVLGVLAIVFFLLTRK